MICILDIRKILAVPIAYGPHDKKYTHSSRSLGSLRYCRNYKISSMDPGLLSAFGEIAEVSGFALQGLVYAGF